MPSIGKTPTYKGVKSNAVFVEMLRIRDSGKRPTCFHCSTDRARMATAINAEFAINVMVNDNLPADSWYLSVMDESP